MVLGNTYDLKLGIWRADAHSLLSLQEFWFAIFMTILYVSVKLSRDYYSYPAACSSLGLPFERSRCRLKL